MNVKGIFVFLVLIALFLPRLLLQRRLVTTSSEYCNYIAVAMSSLNFSMAFAPSSTTILGGSEVPAFSPSSSFAPLAHSARLSSNSNTSSASYLRI